MKQKIRKEEEPTILKKLQSFLRIAKAIMSMLFGIFLLILGIYLIIKLISKGTL